MQTKDYINSFLDDNEKAALEYFADSDTLQQAVKKVILGGLYANGTLEAGKDPDPKRNAALFYVSHAKELGLTNEQIGQDLRAFHMALSILEAQFENFALYKKTEKVVNNENPAR